MTFLPVVLAIAGGVGLVKGYEWWKKSSQPSGTVSELTQNMSYAVVLQVTPAIGTTDAATASAYLKAFFEQQGWIVLTAPMPRSPNDTAAFQAGQPSSWVLTGRWTQPSKYMSAGTPGVSMALFTPLPIQ